MEKLNIFRENKSTHPEKGNYICGLMPPSPKKATNILIFWKKKRQQNTFQNKIRNPYETNNERNETAEQTIVPSKAQGQSVVL